MKISGLDHLQLAMPVGRESEARWFYGEILGLTEIDKPAPLRQRGGCWFQLDGFQIHLGVQKAFIPARKAHPAFLVAQLSEARRRLEAAGIDIDEDTTLSEVDRFYAHDPFGNRLEFVQQGHGFSEAKPFSER